ncbi:MAG: AI-2E family transporter [Actinobacteria bacterium]|nr:AI-2E family transporter [Actinomycetota bacterium]
MTRVERARLWFYRIWAAIGAIALLAGVWYVLRDPLRIILPPLALAVVIVYLLNPFVRMLAARGVPRVAGGALAYVILLGVIVGIASFVGPLVADQMGELADEAPEMAVGLQDTVNAQLTRLGIDASINLDPSSEEIRDAFRQYIVGEQARDQLTNVLSGAGSVAREILHLAVIILLGPVLAFYLLADLPDILDGLRRLIPGDQRDEVLRVVDGVAGRVGGYFRGQLMIAAFVGVATSVGLLLVGLPFWALVGLITGIFNLVPLIGPFVGGAIGVVIALTVGDGATQALLVVIVMTAVQQVDNHIISPNVMSRTVDLHPITVMLALLVAGSLYGILGMLIAIPAVAAMKLIGLHLLATRAPWSTSDLPSPSTVRLPGM